mmetsp:Transcript_40389/g.98001  ORF Transcript_40389/g.98001 Transcript_40389/m.98001 type:complete len:566 (+) Transcript_40389:81-1778(+)
MRVVLKRQQKVPGTTFSLDEGSSLAEDAELHVLLNGAASIASSRRWRVSGAIFAVGFVVFVVASPMTFITVFGVIQEGAFGYALGACPTSYCWLLLAAMPTDAKVIRFIGVFTIVALIGFATIFLLAGLLIVSNAHCVYANSTTCNSVGIGLILFASGCVSMVYPFARVLRRLPGCHRVSLRESRMKACTKLWDCLGTLVFICATPLVWVLAQKEASFAISPRAALQAYWVNFRVIFTIWALMWMTLVLIDNQAYGAPLTEEPVFISLLVCAGCFLLVAGLASHQNRSRIHECLGNIGTRAEASAAASIAALINEGDGATPAEVLEKAKKRFRGLPFLALSATDLSSSQDSGLQGRTVPKLLGQVDCFISHSWHDSGELKWSALQKWARDFQSREGHSPMVWLDKACIDQSDISANLACLPIFLSGCRYLVVLAGPTFCSRLWCVLEIFAFLKMGASLNRVIFLDIDEETGDAFERGDRKLDLCAKFATFDVTRSQCRTESDTQKLLAVIETGFGSLRAFNKAFIALLGESLKLQERELTVSKARRKCSSYNNAKNIQESLESFV